MKRLIHSLLNSKHRGYVLATCIVMMAVILIICSTLIAVSGIESKNVKMRQATLEYDIIAKNIAIDFVKGSLSSNGERNDGYSYIVSIENTETITISRNGEIVLTVSVEVTEKDGKQTRIVTSWTNGS